MGLWRCWSLSDRCCQRSRRMDQHLKSDQNKNMSDISGTLVQVKRISHCTLFL